MDNDLEYVSSSPDLRTAKRDVKSQDENDLSTLERVLLRLDKYIANYKTTDALTADETQFTVRERLVLNQRSVLLAEELKLLVETTINDVKEKYKDE